MPKRKTKIELEWASGTLVPGVSMHIVGERPDDKPYVSIEAFSEPMFIPDKDLERFAVNILKALGSKRLLTVEEKKAVSKFKTFKRPLKK